MIDQTRIIVSVNFLDPDDTQKQTEKMNTLLEKGYWIVYTATCQNGFMITLSPNKFQDNQEQESYTGTYSSQKY